MELIRDHWFEWIFDGNPWKRKESWRPSRRKLFRRFLARKIEAQRDLLESRKMSRIRCLVNMLNDRNGITRRNDRQHFRIAKLWVESAYLNDGFGPIK